jgi:hypothetical protein
MMSSKLLRVAGTILAILVFAIVSLILINDPPPLRLWDPEEVALSVPPAPKLDNLRHPIDEGIACHRRLSAYTSSTFLWRREITVSDWLRTQTGKLPAPDIHLVARKRDDTWAVKIDRATNTLCYQKPDYVEAGMIVPYCGPKIIHENELYLAAVEDNRGAVNAVYFNKKTYTLTMTGVATFGVAEAGIEYFDCY